MSLVFAAIVPHPPMLIPAIGRDKIDAINKTKTAMQRLEEELYIAKPNIIVIISPHGSLFADSFSVNGHTRFESNFGEFGDLTTKKEWLGMPELAARVAHAGKTQTFPVQLVSVPRLDYGSAVPLFYLTDHLPEVKILPIGYSERSVEDHLKFGELLKDIAMNTAKRVAVIASGDLSHNITVDTAANLNDAGIKFDRQFRELLEAHDVEGLAALDTNLVKNSEECGYRSALILQGIIKNMNYTFQTYSYECPFGIGYLVGNFVL